MKSKTYIFNQYWAVHLSTDRPTQMMDLCFHKYNAGIKSYISTSMPVLNL